MNSYTTQMDAARKGIVTPQIERVAQKEQMPVEQLIKLVAGERLPFRQISIISAWNLRESAVCSAPR